MGIEGVTTIAIEDAGNVGSGVHALAAFTPKLDASTRPDPEYARRAIVEALDAGDFALAQTLLAGLARGD